MGWLKFACGTVPAGRANCSLLRLRFG